MKYEKRDQVIVNGIAVGSIYKRGDVYWFDYRANGKRDQVSLKTKDLKQAVISAELIAKNAPVIPQAPTADERRHSKSLADVFKLYKADYEKRRRASSARRAFEIVDKFIKHVGETKSAAVVERSHVKAFRDMRHDATSETTERKLSPWTINNDIGRIRHFIRWAAREGYRQQAPDLTDLKLTTETKAARGLAQVEVTVIREKLQDHELLADWFELAINTGFRPDEQAHLRAQDYDETMQKVHVRPWGGWKPKTAKGKRSPMVNAAAAEILKRRKALALAEQGRRKLAGEPEGDALLFPTPVDTKWDLDNLRHRFQELLPDGSYFTLYALRHTYAYREVAAGTPINKLMLRMGHTDPKTTKGYFEGMDLDDIGAPPALEPRKAAAQ